MNCSVECKCSRRWMVFADGHTQIAQVIWVWLILPIGNLNTSLLHLAFGSYFDMLWSLSTCSSSQTSNYLRHTIPFDSNFLLFPRISRLFRASLELCAVRASANSGERATPRRGAAVRVSWQVPLQRPGNLLGSCQSPGMPRWLTACACAIYLLLRDVIIMPEAASPRENMVQPRMITLFFGARMSPALHYVIYIYRRVLFVRWSANRALVLCVTRNQVSLTLPHLNSK